MTTEQTYLLDPVFHLCLVEAARTPELVAEYDRLRGTNLGRRGGAIERLIDDATGRTKAEVIGFVEFVRVAVYEPLVAARVELEKEG